MSAAAVYRFDGEVLEDGVASAHAQQVLAHAHRMKVRPLCDCTPAGVEMYIARVGSGFVVKRMPGTGMPTRAIAARGCPRSRCRGWGRCWVRRSTTTPSRG